MKKIFAVLGVAVLVQCAVAAAAEETQETRKFPFEKIVRTFTRPAEEIVGKVVDLERIVVSPYKIRESSMMSASSVSVITRDDIEERQKRFAKDMLVEYPGVSKTSAGPFGGPTTIRIRGANPNQTLLIIDGVKVYDPTTPDGAFNFANLPFDNVAQIEITRGPQAALYGSDAIGGLINIESRKAYAPYFESGIEAGSFRTLDEYVNVGGYEKGLHYSFAFSQFNTGGISTADRVTIPNIEERDPYVRKSFAGRIDYDIRPGLTFGATLRNIYAWNRYDDSDPMTFALRDNDQLIAKNNLFLYSLYVEHKALDFYDYSVRYGYMNNFRRDYDYVSGLRDWYEGAVNRFDFQNNFHILDYDTFTIGYDYNFEKADSYYVDFANGASDQPKVFASNSGLYMQNKVHYKDTIGASQSMRVDKHSQFGTNITYKLDGFYLAPTGTRLRGVWATGFKAPSLYQLHAPANAAWFFTGGNPNLNPENADSYELGVDQYIYKKMVKLFFTYFQIRFHDLIKYYTDPATFQSTYRNASKAKSIGVEYGTELNLFEDRLKVTASFTSLGTKDYSTDRQLARVPEDQFNVHIIMKPVPKVSIGANIRHSGVYLDIGTDKIKPFTIVDLTTDCEVTKNISFFARVENILNKHYQELRSYGQPGIGAYGGAKAKF